MASCQPPDLQGLKFLGRFLTLSVLFPACLASEKASWASKEDCGRDSFERDKELRERRVSPLQSKSQTPAGGVRWLYVGKHPALSAGGGLCEHRASITGLPT